MNARELLLARVPLDRLAAESEQPVLTLGMVSGRMQMREGRVRQEFDSASRRPARPPEPPFVGQRGGAIPRRLLVLQRRQRRVCVHRRDVPSEPERVGLGGEAALARSAASSDCPSARDGGHHLAPTPRAPGILSDGVAAERG